MRGQPVLVAMEEESITGQRRDEGMKALVSVIPSDSDSYCPTQSIEKLCNVELQRQAAADDDEDEDDDQQDYSEFFSFPCSPVDLAKQRENFLIYLRVLIKYLELKDKSALPSLRSALQECAMLRLDRLNESLILIEMYRRAKNSVSEYHWTTARTYLRLFLVQRKRRDRSTAPKSALISSDGS